MNKLNNLGREEIPQEVLDDIYKHFSTVIWDNYGKPVPRVSIKEYQEYCKNYCMFHYHISLSDDEERDIRRGAHKGITHWDMKTRCSSYHKIIAENVEGTVGYWTRTRIGTLMQRYYIRGMSPTNSNSMDIYSVWSMLVFVPTKDYEIA